MKRALFSAVLVALAAGACDEPIARGWLLDRTRVLGARVEAVAEPSRASLVGGERAVVTWLVASPGATPPKSWSFAVCLPPPGTSAAPACEGAVLASGAGTASGELVAMALETPTVAEPELLMLAAFCLSAAPAALDAKRFEGSCADGTPALLASSRIALAFAGTQRNPEIAGEALTLARSPWPEGTCEQEGPVPVGSADVGYTFRAEAREDGETLVLSQVVSAGELEGQYVAIDPNEGAPKTVQTPWTAPPGRRTVRFYFVLRDGRGGTSFATRTVCSQGN